MRNYDAIVVGLGAMGSAALYHLAKRGCRVCGVDKFAPPHAMGSSHGASRLIRKAYFEHPDYIPLLHRAYSGWRLLENKVQKKLLVQNGLLIAASPDGEVARGLQRCYAAHELPHERLTASETSNRFPQFAVPASHQVIYDPEAGYLRVERSIAALLSEARLNGADIFQNEQVNGWQATGNGFQVGCRTLALHTEKLIFTPGAWAPQLLPGLEIKLEIWRKVMYWFHAEDNVSRETYARIPTFYIEQPFGSFYGVPIYGKHGLKIGEHAERQLVSVPGAEAREIKSTEVEATRRFIKTSLPLFKPATHAASVCFYTMSADGQFILDQHPLFENVFVACGFSGHGFKFAPVIGEALADLTLDGATSLPIEFLRLARFQQPGRS